MKSKRICLAGSIIALMLTMNLTACGENAAAPTTASSTSVSSDAMQTGSAGTGEETGKKTNKKDKEEKHKLVAIKESPDKYTYYMQDYVGKNVAAFGYTSLGGDRMEQYGAGYIHLNLVADDGCSINIEDEDELSQYVVVAQSYEPNTEIKYTFETDSDGNEYSNLVLWQNIDGIDLLVKKVGTATDPNAPELITINPSKDRYTYYMPNYVGKNLQLVGYTSLGGDRMDHIGDTYIQLNIIADDGTYVEISSDDDETDIAEILREYIVVAQNIAPNTEISVVYEVDSEGEEYANLISWKSIEQIDLLVKRIDKELSSDAPELISINASEDRYTYYVRNYVGKNLAAAGYTSLGGKRMDAYGSCYMELVLLSEDGSYIDIEDEEVLRNYRITDQDLDPNTEIKVTYMTDSDGAEYDNLIDTQSYKKITLLVEKIAE